MENVDHCLIAKWQHKISRYRQEHSVDHIQDAFQELRNLEQNNLVTRTVHVDTPVIIEYKLTEYSKTVWPLLKEMIKWGRIIAR